MSDDDGREVHSAKDLTKCGTYAGWNQHKRLGTPVCTECRAARTRYQRTYRFRVGSQRDPLRCRDCGSVFDWHCCGAVVIAKAAS